MINLLPTPLVINVSQIKSDVFPIEPEGNQNPPLTTIIVNFIKRIFLKFIQMGQYFFDKLGFGKGKIQRPSSERLPASPHDISLEGKKDGNNLIEVPSSNPALAQIAPLAISIIKPASGQPFDAEEPGAQAPISPLADASQINSQIEGAPRREEDLSKHYCRRYDRPILMPNEFLIEGAVHLPMPEREGALPEAEIYKINHRICKLEHIKNSLIKKLKAAQKAAAQQKPFQDFDRSDMHLLKPLMGDRIGNFILNDFRYEVCCLQGGRPYQEDGYIATSIKITILGQTKDATIFGICDGHSGDGKSGSKAVDFVKNRLPAEFRNQIYNLINSSQDPEYLIWNALKLTFVKLSENFNEMCGTTAAIAIILDDYCWIANCGDSRIAINENGKMIAMTEDMKPENNKRRIQKRGGEIRNGRVAIDPIRDGVNIGGAIGDHECTGIPARPVITRMQLSELGLNSDLIIGCDGIFDVATTQQVVNKVQELRNSKLNTPLAIASLAYKAGSKDNLSLLLVHLK